MKVCLLILLLCSGLDLPIQPPALHAETPPEVPPEKEDIPSLTTPGEQEGDDPRDTPPPVIYGEEIDAGADTIVFVIDRSDSMRNGWGWVLGLDDRQFYGSRMDKAKIELSKCIRGLASSFRFNLVSYNCRADQWSEGMQPATGPNKDSALAWVRALEPMWGTMTGPATVLGLSFAPNTTVVLLTDGAPNCGASGIPGHLAMILEANTQGAEITVFCISPVRERFRRFCRSVASLTGGSYIEVL
jgi:hypothetical protein